MKIILSRKTTSGLKGETTFNKRPVMVSLRAEFPKNTNYGVIERPLPTKDTYLYDHYWSQGQTTSHKTPWPVLYEAPLPTKDHFGHFPLRASFSIL